jgi:putative sporulation protein YyaC
MNLGKGIFERKLEHMKIAHEDILAKEMISTQLLSLLPSNRNQPIVVVCIGTDRSTGDSLGPLTGTFLKEKGSTSYHVYGTLDDPIHAVNLEEKMKEIYQKHEQPFVIGIDACLGKLKSVGMIQIGEGPVKPGAGVKKDLPFVGDMHITGIVNVSGFMEFFVLQNTRLNLVVNMARIIAGGIFRASLSDPRNHSRASMIFEYEKGQEKTL